MYTLRVYVGIAIVVLLVATGVAHAGLLMDDLNAYDDGSTTWQGRVEFRTSMFGFFFWGADVEYAVYAPASYAGDSFAESWPGVTDPSNGQDFIYAYQIFNDLDPYPSIPPDMTAANHDVMTLSVILRGQTQAANNSFIASTGYDNITNANSKPPTSLTLGADAVMWDYSDGQTGEQVNYQDISDVLFFTSPFGPKMDNATLATDVPNSAMQLPSPLPEPATLVLLAVGAAAILSKCRRPRRGIR